MSNLEELRNNLYLVWEKGSPDDILVASQKLDVEIVKYMKKSIAESRKSAKAEMKTWCHGNVLQNERTSI